MKYGLLDPMPLGEQEQELLKCETCGLEFGNQERHIEDEDAGVDYQNIEAFGKCLSCQDIID